MGVPVVVVWKSFVDAVIEILVVGEDNMATNIVQLVFPLVAEHVTG